MTPQELYEKWRVKMLMQTINVSEEKRDEGALSESQAGELINMTLDEVALESKIAKDDEKHFVDRLESLKKGMAFQGLSKLSYYDPELLNRDITSEYKDYKEDNAFDEVCDICEREATCQCQDDICDFDYFCDKCFEKAHKDFDKRDHKRISL